MSQAHARDVRRYYFLLYLWTRLNRQFRTFSGAENHSIHRWLVDEATGRFSPDTIHRLLAPIIADAGSPDALDAGCGYGGSCLALHQLTAGRWHGITLSPQQAKIARRNARRAGVDDHVTFACRSYDDPPQRNYNLVLAIESLIHSPSPETSLASLCSVLRTGGLFIIVDDMPAEDMPPPSANDLAGFRRMWRCPRPPTLAQYTEILEAAGCSIQRTDDLTGLMRPRKDAEIAAAMADIRGRSWWRRWLGFTPVTDAEIGGLLLERLHNSGAVRYRMIVARKL